MEIKKILISQPKPAVMEKAPFFEIAQKFEIELYYQPFIKVEGVTLKEFRSQRVEILDYSAVIFTSRTTVDSFFRIAEEARLTIPESMKYFCNTEAVALYLQKYIVYRKRKIFFANGSFTNLMELLMKHKEEKFILALSEPHSPELPKTLDKLKFKVANVIFAKTVSNDLNGVDVRQYDLLAFYSPIEIATLVSNFGTDNLPVITTFGEGTTRAATEAGLTVAAMAPNAAAPSLAKAVENLLNDIANGKQIESVAVTAPRKSEEFIKAQEAKPSKRGRSKRKPATSKSTSAKGATVSKSTTVKKSTTAAKTTATTKSTTTKAATSSSGSTTKSKPA